MSRYIRNTVILSKPELTVGVDSLPTGAANAMLISDMNITPLDAKIIDRDNMRGYFGANDKITGPASIKVSFTVELAGSGTAATAPAWGNLLLGCAMAEGLLATPARVEYTPVSTGLKTLTIYYYDDGVVHKLLAAMGTVSLMAKVGDIPKLKFDFIGLDGGIAEGISTGTYTAWKKPVAMKLGSVTDISIGSVYSLGAYTGGTLYSSTGIELMSNNALSFNPLLGIEKVDITNREYAGSIELDLTPAQEVSFMGLVKADAVQSLAITIGVQTGNKIIVHCPRTQFTNPKKVDLNGTRMCGYDITAQPVSGNDELRFVLI